MEDPCHVHRLGEELIDMCDRVRVAHAVAPGSRGELRLIIGERKYRITVEVLDTP